MQGPTVIEDSDHVDSELYGILQFTCALRSRLPAALLPRERSFDVLSDGFIRSFRRDLERSFLPMARQVSARQFQLLGLTDGQLGNPPMLPDHTWLINLSRHVAMSLPEAFRRRVASGRDTNIPATLDWNPAIQERESEWCPYIRVQRAREPLSGRFLFRKAQAGSLDSEVGDPMCDCNDYLVCEEGHPSIARSTEDVNEESELEELRIFIARLLASRRSEIFSSDLSDRMYHVWLPAGILAPEGRAMDSTSFALLPFATLVRRPYRQSWRQSFSVSCVFVPWTSTVGTHSAPVSIHVDDIDGLIWATEGSSTYTPVHGTALWRLLSSPLRRYFEAFHSSDSTKPATSRLLRMSGTHPPDVCPSSECEIAPGATLRQWLEVVLHCVAESRLRVDFHSDIADEVLRGFRMTHLWNVVLLSRELASLETSGGMGGESRLSSSGQPTVADRPAARGVAKSVPKAADIAEGQAATVPEVDAPNGVLSVLSRLAWHDRAHMPTSADRIDDPVRGLGGSSRIIWFLERVHTLITAYDLEDESFPSFSALNLFGRISHMMIACTTTQAALDALGHEVARSEGVVDLAREGHERILELEEMYDLDLAWPEYARFYQRLRNRMHLEEQYSQVRDRVSLLTRFFEIEDRVGQEQRHDAEARQRADDAERRRRDLESFGQRLTFSVGLFALLPATALVLLTLLSVILMGSPWKRPWDLSVFLTLVGCCCFISVVAFVIVLRVRWLRNAIVKLFRRWQDSWREVAS